MIKKESKNISEEIIEHYTGKYDETKRLRDGFGRLERERTQELIMRYVPCHQSKVVDVGGASGIYSFHIASHGHEVHLVDIVPKHIEQAKTLASQADMPELASICIGDARHLDFPDNFADAIVMHGPLYHLIDREDRLKAIAEAKRVLKPMGTLLAFAITRYAGAIYGILKGYIYDQNYFRMTAREVNTGLRTEAPSWLNTFSSAYFHLPNELMAELERGGLIFEDLIGVIGPAWMVPDIDSDWDDPPKREVIIQLARMFEKEPLLGPRILGIARKSK
jgi:ubiquinone/menaquinone biosynthesis C-methylase UbiE